MKKMFKSFNLTHGYKSIFSVGGYNTFTSWQEYMGGRGFINDVTTGLPRPTSQFDISTVSINETFSPLIGVNMTFLNNLSARVEYRKTRILTLSMTNQQLNESRSNDFVIGAGYKIPNFKFANTKNTVKRSTRTTTSRRTNTKDTQIAQNTQTTRNSSGVSTDLNLRFDFSLRDQAMLNRDILTRLTQATSGNKAVQISFSADYIMSRYMTITMYYDCQINKPLMTSSSYPTTTQDFGVSFKFMLNR